MIPLKMLRIFIFTLFLLALFCFTSGAKYYLVEEDTSTEVPPQAKATPLTRLKRQTHPAATIAKLPTVDNNAFIPIVGPTQSFNSQPPFFQNTESFQNTLEFPNARDTPIDYLVPPNPDSQITNLNFQDPAANLQNVENVFDVHSPSSSSSNNFPSFQSLQNPFPSTQPNFQNQIHHPQLSTTQSAVTSDQVQSISFQNPPLTPSPTPSILQNVAPHSLSNQQFLTSKISNPSKEPPLLTNQFPIIPAQFANPNTFSKAEPQQSERSNPGKYELGFDANEILAPPREVDSFSRNSEYDTINVAKFRRLNHLAGAVGQPLSPQPAISNQPPVQTNNFAAPNQFQLPSNQQFPQFNSFAPPSNHISSNDQFTPANSPFAPASNQITTASNQPFSKENTINNPNNIVWGTQKQPFNFAPTTNAPFLPTVPPTAQSQPNVNFQNVATFNSPTQNQPQLHQQFQQAQPNNQLYHFQNANLNQNFALETPLTAQFDTFLPQGTVSDHTFPQHFRKRQVNSEEEEYEEQREEPESKYKHRPGPVYSFVKTDRNGHFKWSVRHPPRR